MTVEKKVYTIEPILEERIWGGQELIKMFNLKTNLKNVAEMYTVIAMPGHLDCHVTEANLPLSVFFEENKELFGCQKEYLPVRMVVGNQIKDLSVQVHPDDEYGMTHSHMRGKPESEWLLGDGEGTMILGHHAKTKEEFIKLAENKEWDKLFRKIKVKGGDFIHIPQGTLHASQGEGCCVAFSTNGDVTYRLYDYDRKDSSGKLRELHVQNVYDVVEVPDENKKPIQVSSHFVNGLQVTEFFDQPGLYTCGNIKSDTSGFFERKEFYFLMCIEGEGKISDRKIKAGQTFFVPCNYGPVEISGAMTIAYISYKDDKK